MANKRKDKQRSKEIWYETTKDKRKRKVHYLPVLSRYTKNINEDLSWIIILLLFIIGLMILWFKLQI